MVERVASAIPHRLGRCEARRRIAEVFPSDQCPDGRAGAGGKLLVRDQWEGYRLNFRFSLLRHRICGRLEVFAESVQIEIDAPDLLVAVAGAIVNALNAGMRKVLDSGVVYPLQPSGDLASSLPAPPYPAVEARQIGNV